MISYLIDVLLLQLLFALFFEVALRSTSLHNWNRFYLVITPLLALLLPKIPLPFFSNPVYNTFTVALNEVVVGAETLAENRQVLSPETETYGLVTYWILGMVLLRAF